MDASAVSQDNIETFSNVEARAVIEKEPLSEGFVKFHVCPLWVKDHYSKHVLGSPLKSVEYKSLST